MNAFKIKNALLACLVTTSVLFFSACQSNNAEDVGENIDETAQDTGNAIEDACEEAMDEDC